MAEMTASQVARRLGVTHRRVNDLVGDGKVKGRRLENGMWLVESDSVLRYETSHRGHAGRALEAATSWAILWELSGMRADWVSARTYARIRNRLAHMTVDELARAVSSRTSEKRFRSANVERVLADVIATGRLATDSLNTDLIVDRRRVVGYVPRNMAMENFARSHFMVEDLAGQDVLLTNTLPVKYDAERMPAGVVAADLAVSLDARERSAGLSALEEMRAEWLAHNTK